MILMKEEIKKRWVEALRSGEFKQGTGALYNPDTGEHCVLGILCELAVQDGVVQRHDHEHGGPSVYGNLGGDDSDVVVPPEVIEWAGLDSCIPLVEYFDEEYGNTYEAVAEMNDRGLSFKYIAELIEEDINEGSYS